MTGINTPDVSEVLADANASLKALRDRRDEVTEGIAKMFKPGDDGNPTKFEFKDDQEKDQYVQFLGELSDLNGKIELAVESVGTLDKAVTVGKHAIKVVEEANAQTLHLRNGLSLDEGNHLTSKQREAWRQVCFGDPMAVSEDDLKALNATIPEFKDANGNPVPSGFHDRAVVTSGGNNAATGFGGRAVPTMVSNMLTVTMATFSAMMDEAMVAGGGMANVNWPGTDDTNNEGDRVAEGTDAGAQDLSFEAIPFNRVRTTSRVMEFTEQWLRATAIMDVEAAILGLAAERIARSCNRAYTSNATYGVSARATVGYNAAGTATLANVAKTAALNALFYAVDESYRMGDAIWMVNDRVIQAFADLAVGNTDARPVVMASFKEGFGTVPTIHGKRVRINNHLADPANNAIVMLFGDFMRYRMEIVNGSRRMFRFSDESVYAKPGNVGFLLAQYDAGNLLQPKAISKFQAKT